MRGYVIIVTLITFSREHIMMLIVPCNYPDVWEFGPLGLCVSVGRQWAPNCGYHFVLEPEFLANPANGVVHPTPGGRKDLGF